MVVRITGIPFFGYVLTTPPTLHLRPAPHFGSHTRNLPHLVHARTVVVTPATVRHTCGPYRSSPFALLRRRLRPFGLSDTRELDIFAAIRC